MLLFFCIFFPSHVVLFEIYMLDAVSNLLLLLLLSLFTLLRYPLCIFFTMPGHREL